MIAPPPPILHQLLLCIYDICFLIMFVIVCIMLRRIISRTTGIAFFVPWFQIQMPLLNHITHCHKILYRAAPPFSFLFQSMPIVKSDSKNIIFLPGELENRSDQILLLLLLSQHLLVSFALSTLGILIWLCLLQRRKANNLELHCIFLQEETPKLLTITFEDIKQEVV